MVESRGVVVVFAIAVLAAPLNAQETAMWEAMSAAPEEVAANATIADAEGNVIREGTNRYTCLATPSGLLPPQPMCLDETWMVWVDAWKNKVEPVIDEPGIAYMLGGDGGVSNSDPYGLDRETVDDWVSVDRHLMLLLPNETSYDAFPTDPSYGGPWIMWKGTPYAHVMIPISAVKYQGEDQ